MSALVTEARDEWPAGDRVISFDDDTFDKLDGPLASEPPHPVNWNLLTADEAQVEWIGLKPLGELATRDVRAAGVCRTALLHRHPQLVWELSALHLHWFCAYDPDQHGSAPFDWHRDFPEARQRLHDWVAISGTRLERDRSTRQTA